MSDSIQNSVATTPPQTAPDASAAEPYVTRLTTALGESSLPLTEYRGTQTIAEFSGSAEELRATVTTVGVYDLGWRTFLQCTGRDRVRWLNGMVTNSVKDLKEDAGCYAFVLNAQGRIQGDLDIYRSGKQPDALWLQTDRAQAEPLTAFMRRYIIMDQVALEPQSSVITIGLVGPRAANTIAQLGLPGVGLSPIHLEEGTWQGHAVTVAAAHSPRVPRYEIWIESDRAIDLWKALTGTGAVPCGSQAVEQLRILEGTPAYGIDIADRDLPQETNQTRALSFTKGCYLGQEIVERIRSRGNVHRTFSGFVLDRNEIVAAKSPLLAGDKPVGELTSVARIAIPDFGERVLALGHIRREVLDSEEGLTAGGIAVTPHALPFDFASAAVQP